MSTDAWGQTRSVSPKAGDTFARSEPKPSKSLRQHCEENQQSIMQMFCIAGAIMLVYMFFSDGDFSFLLTLSSILSLVSFLKVAWVIWHKKSVVGVSSRMMECYVFAFFSRLVSILWMDGYLPYDRSGDYIYRITEIGCFLMSLSIVYACRVLFVDTYDQSSDSLKSWYLILPSVIMGVMFHPHLNGYTLCDVAWSQGLYLEAFACIPQLVLFRSQKKVEAFTTNFLMTQILVRVFSFIFWASSSRDLHSYHLEGTIRTYASSMVVVMQLLQMAVMCDFLYQWFQCWRKGTPLTYILNDVV